MYHKTGGLHIPSSFAPVCRMVALKYVMTGLGTFPAILRWSLHPGVTASGSCIQKLVVILQQTCRELSLAFTVEVLSDVQYTESAMQSGLCHSLSGTCTCYRSATCMIAEQTLQ